MKMEEAKKQAIGNLPQPPIFKSLEEERRHRLERLTAAFRLFSLFGFDEGVAGHITVRDPEHTDYFWLNPFGVHFSHIRASDLVLVNHAGEIVEGNGAVNRAAFAIHSEIHKARPDVNAACHAHSFYGRTWSSLGRMLDPISQDACAFYEDHVLFDDYTGTVLESEEGRRIAKALDNKKAAILRNHGILTVGASVDEAAWWFISMEKTCKSQIVAESVGKPISMSKDAATKAHSEVGSELAGWFSFQPLYEKIIRLQPDLLH